MQGLINKSNQVFVMNCNLFTFFRTLSVHDDIMG